MKNILIIIISLFTFSLSAQTPYTILSSHREKPATLSASSQNNPWVGAKLVYNVSGDVSESFLLSARALYVAASGDRWALPIVGNVGLNNADSLSNDNGVSLGVFPYFSLTTEGNLQLVLHGGLNYHILDLANSDVQQFRMLVGLEAAMYPDGPGSPTTLSVAPEYILNTGDLGHNSWGLAVTGVVPIANGLGLLLEGTVPFQNDTQSTGFRLGVIVNSDIK